MIKSVLKNIWEWGVKPVAVGSAIVGAIVGIGLVLWYAVVQLTTVYESQFGWNEATSQSVAVFTPFAVVFVWVIGLMVISWRRETKRFRKQNAEFNRQRADYNERVRLRAAGL